MCKSPFGFPFFSGLLQSRRGAHITESFLGGATRGPGGEPGPVRHSPWKSLPPCLVRANSSVGNRCLSEALLQKGVCLSLPPPPIQPAAPARKGAVLRGAHLPLLLQASPLIHALTSRLSRRSPGAELRSRARESESAAFLLDNKHGNGHPVVQCEPKHITAILHGGEKQTKYLCTEGRRMALTPCSGSKPSCASM